MKVPIKTPIISYRLTNMIEIKIFNAADMAITGLSYLYKPYMANIWEGVINKTVRARLIHRNAAMSSGNNKFFPT